jgi:hypothetical protein
MIHEIFKRPLKQQHEQTRGTRNWVRIAALCGALALCLLCTAKANAANTWYVSSLNTGYMIDGKTWNTAWPDMNYLNWTMIQPGDTIKIDTGTGVWPHASTSYRYPLTVGKSGTAASPITIEAAPDSGHNAGIIDMHNTINIGNNSYITICGNKWYKGLAANVGYTDVNPSYVPDFMIDGATTGITIASGASNITLSNLWIARGGYGVSLSTANNVLLSNCLLGDNTYDNVAFYPAMASAGLSHISHCWIYGNTRNGNGVSTYSGYQPASGNANLELDSCLLGPGLGDCVHHLADHTLVNVYSTLMIDGINTGMRASNPSGLFSGIAVTTFQTPLNVSGQGNYCLAINNTQNVQLNQSIVYGGTVTPTQTNNQIGNDNFQFKDYAATYLISPTQVDPQFNSNVAAVANNASFDTLCNLDFGLQATSPVLADPNVTSSPYFAARVSSVSQFLGSVPH